MLNVCEYQKLKTTKFKELLNTQRLVYKAEKFLTNSTA